MKTLEELVLESDIRQCRKHELSKNPELFAADIYDAMQPIDRLRAVSAALEEWFAERTLG